MKSEFFEKICLSSFEKQSKILDFYSKSVLYTLKFLNEDYIGFDHWFVTKVMPELLVNNREVITYLHNDQIAAISILKNNISEKKISTIRVMPKFSNMGLGKLIILDAISYLESDSPAITIPEKKINQFTRILKHFNFKLNDINNTYNRINNREYFYNIY